jgi:dolichyl-phosphate beta-glucosyltransferase
VRELLRVSDLADVTSEGADSTSLSLVIPAYNEARNLRNTLQTSWSFLASRAYPTELLIVDDGSEDSTSEVVSELLAANGDLIVFSDADLATPLRYLDDFLRAVERGCDVVIGSREGRGAERIGEPKYRHLMGRAFNLIVRALCLPGIQDTQCGFKLFTKDVADEILSRTRLYSDPAKTVQGARVTAFDVELLVIAKRLRYRICGMPVVWTYGKGSKVNPVRDTWANFMDVMTVKINDIRGRYS